MFVLLIFSFLNLDFPSIYKWVVAIECVPGPGPTCGFCNILLIISTLNKKIVKERIIASKQKLLPTRSKKEDFWLYSVLSPLLQRAIKSVWRKYACWCIRDICPFFLGCKGTKQDTATTECFTDLGKLNLLLVARANLNYCPSCLLKWCSI